MVRSGMTDNPETWPHCLSERDKQNADAPPRNWAAACALSQIKMGVPLTEAHKELVGRVG
ncbi:hypothetical protein [Acetobacter aceti]|uniref:hypothetical protein n=1 Tax=Acetobacter aceti TaxID=435 RepID=UPI0011AF4285|nr:hypothetical protein [Acetobacter aceti]